MWYHATSTSICDVSSRRADTAGRADVEPKLDITRYHMIELEINLMDFSAVTIFLVRVVDRMFKKERFPQDLEQQTSAKTEK